MLVLGGYGEGLGLADKGIRVIPADRPSYAVARDGVIYAALERDGAPGGVLAVREDGTVLAVESSGGDSPCHLAFHGHWLLVANYGGTVGVLPLYEDGGLGALHEAVAHVGSGPNAERQEGPHVHQVVVSPGGGWVLAVDLGTDEVVVYAFADGELTRHGAYAATPGSGPRHLAFSPDGAYAYLVGELDDSLTKLAWHEARGELSTVARLRTLPENVALTNYPGAVRVSADGSLVYVTNRGHDSIAVVDAGPFRLRTTVPCGGEWPRDAVLSGDLMYVANQFSGTVDVLALEDGVPAVTGERLEFPAVTSVLPL
ncbi:hypothetical protein Afil01_39480 [Actinorhabdospora filicis]|uniref:Lactonase family protein n=1 Tax=Actinorhabdospora filicis TaxID=1785913 RepID=A0A9W6SNG1_9ACTN|nr:lactonase family protein [Actinorhabdospora filicis]GLZ79141.1 hypothetical protein Afil01_39480 [Actinorhabdospora filicis]